MDAEDDDVAERVKSAAEVENIGVLEGNLLGDLHHTKDDDQVGAVHMLASGFPSPARGCCRGNGGGKVSARLAGGDVSYTCGERPIVNMLYREAGRLEKSITK